MPSIKTRLTVLVSLVFTLILLTSSAAFAAAGDLDGSYGGGDGTLLFNSGGTVSDSALGVATRNGFVATAGEASAFPTDDVLVTRSTTAGVPDVGFGGGDGIVTSSFVGSGNSEFFNAVAIDSSDRIVAAGGTVSGGLGHLLVARFTTTGALDGGFGTGGATMPDVGTVDNNATGVAVQSDGKILVTGIANNGAGYFAFLMRLKADGTPDPKFSGDGLVTFHFKGSTGNPSISDVEVAKKSGLISVSGTALYTDDRFALAQFNSNGTSNKLFSKDGQATYDVELGNERANALILMGDKIVVTGGRSGQSLDVIRVNPNGGLDKTFSGDGKLIELDATTGSPGQALVKQGTKIVTVTTFHGGPFDAFGVIRITGAGGLDPTFGGGDGLATADFGAEGAEPNGVVVVGGNILAAGGAFFVATDNDVALAMFLGS